MTTNFILQNVYGFETTMNLKQFLNEFQNAEKDLKWIRETSRIERNFRNGNDFDDPHLQNDYNTGNQNTKTNRLTDGDEWYHSFRNDESKLKGKPIDGISVLDDTRMNHIGLNQIQVSIGNSNPLVLTINHDLEHKRITKDTEKYQDQIETTKNNLSHEADYKLSKLEQEKSENENQPVPPPRPSTDRSIELHPNNEIKLKIAARMESKGFNQLRNYDSNNAEPKRTAHLVSMQNLRSTESPLDSSYEQFENLKRHRPVPNYNLFKRNNQDKTFESSFTRRKVLEFSNNEDNVYDMNYNPAMMFQKDVYPIQNKMTRKIHCRKSHKHDQKTKKEKIEMKNENTEDDEDEIVNSKDNKPTKKPQNIKTTTEEDCDDNNANDDEENVDNESTTISNATKNTTISDLTNNKVKLANFDIKFEVSIKNMTQALANEKNRKRKRDVWLQNRKSNRPRRKKFG